MTPRFRAPIHVGAAWPSGAGEISLKCGDPGSSTISEENRGRIALCDSAPYALGARRAVPSILFINLRLDCQKKPVGPR